MIKHRESVHIPYQGGGVHHLWKKASLHNVPPTIARPQNLCPPTNPMPAHKTYARPQNLCPPTKPMPALKTYARPPPPLALTAFWARRSPKKIERLTKVSGEIDEIQTFFVLPLSLGKENQSKARIWIVLVFALVLCMLRLRSDCASL